MSIYVYNTEAKAAQKTNSTNVPNSSLKESSQNFDSFMSIMDVD